jgi:hypothetical protein
LGLVLLGALSIAGSALASPKAAGGCTDSGTDDPGVGILSVTPNKDYVITGDAGQDFTPHSKTYFLTNRGSALLEWRAYTDANWVTTGDPDHGFLGPGRTARVTLVAKQSTIKTFAPGSYSAAASFVNVTTGSGSARRDIRLTVDQDDGSSGDKPGPNNTGPYDESVLVPKGTMTITTDGFVLENVKVTGTIYIRADNVTVRNFKIDANGSQYGIECVQHNNGILIEDGEIVEAQSCGVYGMGFTARRLEIHECGGDSFKAHGDVLVEDSYVHHLGMATGAHADGDQTRTGSHITFRHNNFDMPVGLPGYESNSAFLFAPEIGVVNDILVEDNWLNGGNYTVYFAYNSAFGAPMNCRLLNNRFGREYHWGVLINDSPGSVVSGNVWDDTGEMMDINNQ